MGVELGDEVALVQCFPGYDINVIPDLLKLSLLPELGTERCFSFKLPFTKG
jgi:hypothetical protein